MPTTAILRNMVLGAVLTGCSAPGSLGGNGYRGPGADGADAQTATPASDGGRPPAAASTAPSPADSPNPSEPIDDSEDSRASPPQQVTGAFLTSCANVGANGFGCTVSDKVTGKKSTAKFDQLVATVAFSDGTVAKPTLTNTPAADPWLFYFRLSATQVPLVASMRLDAVAAGRPYSATVAGTAIARQPPQPTVMPAKASVLFVTKKTYTPGVAPFDKIASIDTECRTIAANARGIPDAAKLEWTAVLSSDTATDQGTVISNYVYNTPVTADMYNTAGERVSVATGLFGAHSARVVTDENGAYIGEGALVWSGSTNAGALVTGSTCGSWRSSNGMATAGISSDPVNWLQSTQVSCNQALRVYCLGTQ